MATRGAELESGPDVVVGSSGCIDVVVGMDAPNPNRAGQSRRWATTSFMFVLVDVPDPVW